MERKRSVSVNANQNVISGLLLTPASMFASLLFFNDTTEG